MKQSFQIIKCMDFRQMAPAGVNLGTGLLIFILSLGSCALLYGQEISPEQQQHIDAALPHKALVLPKQPRRLLVTNLAMRDGKPWQGSSNTAIPAQNYAIEQMGKLTGAYEAVFNNDVAMFRADSIKQFDAVCFLNTVGVLFEDPELKKSLLEYIAGGKGFVGIHDAIATFVQYPVYDQWPAFGQMLGGTENGGHPWDGELMTVTIEDTLSPLTKMFSGGAFQIVDQAFQMQEPLFRDYLHVLLCIDVERTGLVPERNILSVRKQDLDFPMSWIRAYDQGRVFYFGLGHTAKVFWDRALLEHMLAGIQFALGDLEADTRPTPKPISSK
jgi:hypothetical protein